MSSYHGKWGFDNMSHLKPVVDQANLLLSFRYPPYSKATVKLLRFILPFRYSRRKVIKLLMALVFIILFFVFVLPCLLKHK